MWTGIIRRFSSEGDTLDPYPQPAPESLHHQSRSRSLPDDMGDAAADTLLEIPDDDEGPLPLPLQPPPLDPVVLHGYKDSTPRASRLLTPLVAEEVRSMVPERLRIAEDWTLIYSLAQNGASLATLYHKCRHYAGMRVGFVLVISDQEGGTFGAYLSDYPHPAPSYFGNGECFLWRASTLPTLPISPSSTPEANISGTDRRGDSSDHGSGCDPCDPCCPDADADALGLEPGIRFKAFPYSGLNDYYINCESGFLSLGSGGGHYGLWLDDSLDVGHSSTCETFGNEPLSDAGHKFRVVGLELWVLGASSHP